MIASRLQVNLDDLLWVLTDSQMKAAIVFANSLRDVIQKSNKQSKHLAAEKLQVMYSNDCFQLYWFQFAINMIHQYAEHKI